MPGPGTFEHVGRGWHRYVATSWSAIHAIKVMAILENDLCPFIGRRPLAEITAQELLRQARRVEARAPRRRRIAP